MELYPGKGSAPVNCQRSSSLPYSRIDGGDDPNPLSDLRLDQSSTFPSDPTLTGQPNADNNCARQYYEGPIQVTISPIHTKNNTPSLAFQGSPSPSSGPPNVDVIATNEDVKINITHPPANGQNNQVISVRQACPPPCSPPACTPVCSPCQPCPSPCIPTCPPCAIPCQPPCFPLCAPCPKPCPPCPSACYACIPCPQPPPATGEQAKAEKSPPMVCYPQTCCPMAQPVCYGPMAEGQYVFVQPCCCKLKISGMFSLKLMFGSSVSLLLSLIYNQIGACLLIFLNWVWWFGWFHTDSLWGWIKLHVLEPIVFNSW